MELHFNTQTRKSQLGQVDLFDLFYIQSGKQSVFSLFSSQDSFTYLATDRKAPKALNICTATPSFHSSSINWYKKIKEDFLYVFSSVFLQTHPSVCFMFAWEQHHGSSAAWVLLCFLLCSRFKQFRISVASLSSRGHTVASRDVSFSSHCLCSMCVFWCPVPVSVTGVCPPVLRF